LIIVAVVGLMISAVVHFCSLFHIYNPSRELMILINAGIIVTIWPAILIAKKMRDAIDMADPKELLFKTCPRWLTAMTGFLLMYAFVGLIYFMFKRYSYNSGIAANGFRGFTGHWMALYSLALAILYSCERLKKQQ
jgi:hypothetical protein